MTLTSAKSPRRPVRDISLYRRPEIGGPKSGEPMKMFILIILLSMIVVLSYDIYALRSLKSCHGDNLFHPRPVQPVAWIHPGEGSYSILHHVERILLELGFAVSRRHEPSRWDLLWTHEQPGNKSPIGESSHRLQPHQMINKIPGSGFVTTKRALALLKLPFCPTTFVLPDEGSDFLRYATSHHKARWLVKSNSHRGVRLHSVAEVDLKNTETFVQEFVEDLLLIDGRRFDIGVYAVVTSISPLRVYAMGNDILVRFCSKEYDPLNVTSVDSYVVADDYTPIWEIPTLKKFISAGYNSRSTLQAFLSEKKLSYGHIERQMFDAIAEVYIRRQRDLMDSANKLGPRKFFELVRFDFIVNSDLRVFLTEVNMSPNMDSSHFHTNAVLYEEVLMNTFSLVGLASAFRSSDRTTVGRPIVEVRDVWVNPHVCVAHQCSQCQLEICQLCQRCISSSMKEHLLSALVETYHQRSMIRVVPSGGNHSTADKLKEVSRPCRLQGEMEYDKLQCLWFHSKGK